MSMLWGKAMTSLGSLFSPLGTTANLKLMFEKCVCARTKKEEEWLIKDCLKIVKSRLQEPSTTPPLVTRGLAFVIFADMLGYNSEFAQIHAVKLAQFGSLCEKKIGYLSCIFLMRTSDPLAVMVTNTILRDLGSKNILVVAMAISASCYLIPTNLASTVLPLLAEKLNHPSEYLRSKAVVAFHHFLRICAEQCCHYLDSVCFLLGDKDPCVVGYVLQFLLDVGKVNKTLVVKCVPLLIKIQHQILSGKLSDEHNYRGLPAPWIQMTLLRLFEYSDDHHQEIAALCHKTWEMLKVAENCALREALKVQCLTALVHLEGGDQNLNLSMDYIEELLSSNNCNLRYVGLDLLQTIIQHYKIPLTSAQQQVILSCLEHSDSTVKHKTLHLLCVTANEKNVDMVCSQVAENARSCCGDNLHLQAELVKEAIILIDKFPNNRNFWHVAMLIRLLLLADKMQTKIIQQRIKTALSSENEHIIPARQKVLQILRKYSESKTASTSVLEMFVWALSHFGITCGENSDHNPGNCIKEILNLGRKILKHQVVNVCLPPEIEKILVAINNALTHIIDLHGVVNIDVIKYIDEVKSMAINNLYLHRYCLEILCMLPHSQELVSCFKNVNWCSDIEEIDLTLSFLDWYVCESLKNGENLYVPKHHKVVDTDGSVLDSECFLYREVNSGRNLSDVCSSPVSSEKESCLGSLSFEDLKFDPMRSSEKEIIDSKVVWTKTGRVHEITSTVVDETPQVPSIDSPENSLKLVVSEKSGCTEEKVEESLDPLEKLLSQDFQKLYLNPKEG